MRQQFVGEVGTFGVTFPHICCMPKTMKSVDFSQSYSEIKEGGRFRDTWNCVCICFVVFASLYVCCIVWSYGMLNAVKMNTCIRYNVHCTVNYLIFTYLLISPTRYSECRSEMDCEGWMSHALWSIHHHRQLDSISVMAVGPDGIRTSARRGGAPSLKTNDSLCYFLHCIPSTHAVFFAC